MDERQLAGIFAAFAKQLEGGQFGVGGKQPAGTPIVPPWFGQAGLFSCLESDQLISAAVTDVGIAAWLNWKGSVNRNREQGILASIQKETTEQDGPCDDCPSYEFTACSTSFCFGRLCADSPELLADEMGVRPYENVPIWRLYGSIPGGQQNQMITRDDEWAMIMAGMVLNQHIAQVMWPGDPSNNSANGGYAEPKGLELLINTGYIDIHTGVLCEAVDSDVKAYNRQIPCDTANTNAFTLYRMMVSLYRTIQYRAETGLGARINPSDMLFVSVPEVIDGIIDCLACTYYPCLAGAGSTQGQINLQTAADFRDRMFAQEVFHIDGVDIPWMKDPFMTSTTGLAFGDETCADLFLITRRHGPIELTFGEYQNMATAPDNTMFNASTVSRMFSTDGGRFLAAIENLNYCWKAKLLVKPRVITLAPWLCGRITDICVRSPQHYPSPEPDSPYFVDGGHGTPLSKTLYDLCADEDLTPAE